MRALLLVVMFALLPLRGWTGEAMAIGMALQTAGHTAHHGAADRSPGAEHSPCGHELSAAAGAETMPAGPIDLHPCDGCESKDEIASGECRTCPICQIGHTVALAPDAVNLRAAPQPAHPITGSPTRFVSAEPRRDHKPPIS